MSYLVRVLILTMDKYYSCPDFSDSDGITFLCYKIDVLMMTQNTFEEVFNKINSHSVILFNSNSVALYEKKMYNNKNPRNGQWTEEFIETKKHCNDPRAEHEFNLYAIDFRSEVTVTLTTADVAYLSELGRLIKLNESELKKPNGKRSYKEPFPKGKC